MKMKTIDKDIQDIYYIDFEVMKKIIGLQNTNFSKIDLIEEVKHKYNEQTNDIMDFYVYLKKNQKYLLPKKYNGRKYMLFMQKKIILCNHIIIYLVWCMYVWLFMNLGKIYIHKIFLFFEKLFGYFNNTVIMVTIIPLMWPFCICF